MGDIGDETTGTTHRDLPAWAHLLFGVLLVAPSVWAIATGFDEQLRREYAPYLFVLAGTFFLAVGVREWVRTGSPTARRVKSRAEVERDAERAAGRRGRRLILTLVVAAVVLVALTLR